MKMDYVMKKQAILNDKMLSDEGKRKKLDELQKQVQEELRIEELLINERQKSVRTQLDELKASKYRRPLPAAPIKKPENMDDTDKAMITLLSQSVGLLAEQRAGERLVAKLTMTGSETEFLQALDDATFENPASVVRVYPMIKTLADRFENKIGLTTRLNQGYAKALDLEMDDKERKWQEENALKLQELEKREAIIFTESIQLQLSIDNMANEVATAKGEKYFFNDGQAGEKQSNPYFENLA